MPARLTHQRTCHRHRAPPSCARPSWWRPPAWSTTGRRRPRSGWARSASARSCSAARQVAAWGARQHPAPACAGACPLPAERHPPRACTCTPPQGATATQQVSDFKLGSVWHLLLASYESMRRFGPELAGVCDILVCDEGHRWGQPGGACASQGSGRKWGQRHAWEGPAVRHSLSVCVVQAVRSDASWTDAPPPAQAQVGRRQQDDRGAAGDRL